MKIQILIVVCLTCLLTISGTVSAQSLLFTLSPSSIDALPGMQQVFDATIDNTGSTLLALNQLSVDIPGTGLTADPTDFILNTPPTLAAGDSWTGNIFTVSIDSGAAPGLYLGEATLLGGPTASDTSSLGSANFSIDVVPEPPTAILLITGAGFVLFASICFRRCRET